MLRILFLVLSMMSGGVNASGSIYHAEVPIDGPDSVAERAAKKEAFLEVLERTSGQKQLEKNPVIKRALPKAQQYINQFGFLRKENTDILTVEFDGKKVRDLLGSAKVKLWAEPRPDVLFWIVDNSQFQRNILWETSNHELIQKLKNEGVKNGLPTFIPIGDFDDVVSISVNDLWGGFVSQIDQASKRYQPDGVVLLRVANDNVIEWQFYPDYEAIMSQTPIQGSETGNLDTMLSRIFGDLVDYYVKNTSIYVAPSDASDRFQWISVSGVNSSKDYFALERFLKSLTSVVTFQIYSFDKGNVMLNVNLQASLAVFENELRNDPKMTRQENADYKLVLPLSSGAVRDFGDDSSNNSQHLDETMPSPYEAMGAESEISGRSDATSSPKTMNNSTPLFYAWQN